MPLNKKVDMFLKDKEGIINMNRTPKQALYIKPADFIFKGITQKRYCEMTTDDIYKNIPTIGIYDMSQEEKGFIIHLNNGEYITVWFDKEQNLLYHSQTNIETLFQNPTIFALYQFIDSREVMKWILREGE